MSFYIEKVVIEQLLFQKAGNGLFLNICETARFERFLIQRFEDLCGIEGIFVVKVINLCSKAIGKKQVVSYVQKQVAVHLRYPQKCQSYDWNNVNHSV